MEIIASFFGLYLALVFIWAFSSESSDNSRFRVAWATVAIIIFALSATRTGGSDWDNYENLFIYVSRSDGPIDAVLSNILFEPGYVTLNYFFSLLSQDRRSLVVFESFINSSAIWLVLSRVKGGPLLLVYLFPLQFANILGVRQTLASSLFIFSMMSFSTGTRRLWQVLAVSVHLSALVLIVASITKNLTLSFKKITMSIAVALGAWFVFSELVLGKVQNYLQSTTDLTDLSGTEVLLGKSATLGCLFGISYLAWAWQRDDLNQTPFRPVLFVAATFVSLFAYFLPPFARLLTPLEFLIAWDVCQSIQGVEGLSRRVWLTTIVVVLASAKLTKVYLQFQDVYEVCFLCG